MGGIRISRSATAAVHAEGPGGGDSATLCGKGADYISTTTEEVGCKTCLRKLAIVAEAAADTLRAARNGMASATAAEYAERQRSWGGIDGADRVLRDMRVAAEIASDGILADWLTDALIALENLDKKVSYTPVIDAPRAEACVIITGNRIHADGAPCGTVYDDDLISGVDTEDSADCLACLSQPMERIAGDGSMIRVGSHVTVGAEGASDGSTPTGIVTSLAYYEGGEWVPLVTVEHVEGGLPYGYYAEHLTTVPADAVTPARIAEAEALMDEIEEWQATHRSGTDDGRFVPDGYSTETIRQLWDAGRVVPGSRTAPGKLGWFSVRMIDVDHAEALSMDARNEVTATPEPQRDAWHRLCDSLATNAERERSCAAMDAADRVLWPLGVPEHVFRPETWYAVAMEVYRAAAPSPWSARTGKRKIRKGRR